jgi:hypothetical protein
MTPPMVYFFIPLSTHLLAGGLNRLPDRTLLRASAISDQYPHALKPPPYRPSSVGRTTGLEKQSAGWETSVMLGIFSPRAWAY